MYLIALNMVQVLMIVTINQISLTLQRLRIQEYTSIILLPTQLMLLKCQDQTLVVSIKITLWIAHSHHRFKHGLPNKEDLTLLNQLLQQLTQSLQLQQSRERTAQTLTTLVLILATTRSQTRPILPTLQS